MGTEDGNLLENSWLVDVFVDGWLGDPTNCALMMPSRLVTRSLRANCQDRPPEQPPALKLFGIQKAFILMRDTLQISIVSICYLEANKKLLVEELHFFKRLFGRFSPRVNDMPLDQEVFYSSVGFSPRVIYHSIRIPRQAMNAQD
ncbi:hypothetical protein CRM22_001964 [Opisthorchis felineus]|uniref:Uncharacterized protein n=1 Tax=Opisthorchis felineus TaxID=147828 RepID=A0A4S2M879_OPIFE|nr:hypothetical protein CRM22_001964 [Opisthorchis felineus]